MRQLDTLFGKRFSLTLCSAKDFLFGQCIYVPDCIAPVVLMEALFIFSRSFSSYSIWCFTAETYFLPVPCCMCIFKMHFCGYLCAALVAHIRHYIGRPGLCYHSLAEN